MTTIILCDDNEQHLAETTRVIRQEAASHNELVSLLSFSAPNVLLDYVKNNADVADIAILDIAMQEMNGIQLALQIHTLSPQCQIIFLTGYESYLTDVYEADHVYSVLKKALAERIWPAIEKARQRYAELDQAFYTAVTTAGTEICRYSDILCFERLGRKTRIRTKQHDLWIKPSLRELDHSGFPKYFIRCHQSFIINLNQVNALETDCFLLRNGERIPISRAYRKAAHEAFWSCLNSSILDF